MRDKEKIKEIYEILPKLNCGFCGFSSCGQFARAVVEGKASPFGCKQNPRLGYRIGEIIEGKVPAHNYGHQSAPVSGPAVSSTPQALRQEVGALSQDVDDILARIENLKVRR